MRTVTSNNHVGEIDFKVPDELRGIAESCRKMAEVDFKDPQKMAAHLLGISLKYYGVVLGQSERSFQ
jgi:hypothetical protein